VTALEGGASAAKDAGEADVAGVLGLIKLRVPSRRVRTVDDCQHFVDCCGLRAWQGSLHARSRHTLDTKLIAVHEYLGDAIRIK
jgi:hypothetical protein